jgi:DMSO/TMAO reductase YedYZ molybdopterin-dependent catalytic subunit
VATPAGKPLPRYVEWKRADALIVHSPNTIETRREAFGTSVITPVSMLFVRNNVSPPEASIVEDPDAWRLSLDGVRQPREITVGELKTMGIETLPMVLQCSGNGRDFFPHDPSGTQWRVGAAGCVIWSGVPLRLVVPGYTGVNSVKYLRRLAFTERESDARIMASRYRLSPIGEQGDPGDPSVQQMSVKSWINSPTPHEASPKAGTVIVHGVAFGGLNAVRRVEVSIDGGSTWRDAPLVGPDLGRYAWRQFALPVKLGPGDHVLASRATDGEGTVQPRERMENASGYNNTSWEDHAVKVSVS